ncbi:MAG: GDSL-type esterase/lipase family protein [Candidatus Accumulibacter sp.]|jgi:acyl-CoA hydrolase|nr:GDSL-type esterase/lipase family protein [Accumulibacter sp.]
MQRRNFIQFIVLAALMGACGRKKLHAPLSQGATVLAFGDSVTYGVGAGSGEDWPSLLARRARWNIVNAGISGDTTETALQRIAPLLDQYEPELVIIEIGGNDFLNRRPPKTVKENLRQIVLRVRRHNAATPVVLVAVPELSLLNALVQRLSDSPIYAELAKESKLWLIDSVFSDVLSDKELRSDQVHPNARGYRQMADRIGDALRKFGFIAS